MRRRDVSRLVVLIVAIGVLAAACRSNELSRSDRSAGLNGGFETIGSGYPVNWAFFPNPESSDAVEVSVDAAHALEGAHALKLEVEQSDRPAGFRSRRMPVEPGMRYRIRFSVRNDGCSLTVRRTVQGATGQTNIRSDTIASTEVSSEEWQGFEEILTVSRKEAYVVLVFLVEGSGTLWCDDVTIEEVAE